jgi:hypothetical protein
MHARLPTSITPTWTKVTIEAKGLAPLRPHLDAIAAIRDKHDLARVWVKACERMSMR